LSETDGEDATTKKRTPSRKRELAWLEESVPRKPIDAREVIKRVLCVIQPLARELRVSLIPEVPDELPSVVAQVPALRQALLYVLTVATRHLSDGQVTLSVRCLPRQTHVLIQVTGQRAGPFPVDIDEAEDLKMARRLIMISGGSLEAKLDADGAVPVTVGILLPTAEEVPVLFVDDNQDTLQLMQRALDDSRYRFVGTTDPEQVAALVERESPGIIVLDVMLPGIDGWELLGRLRAHPQSCDVPIIVCTILSQERLALTLGATTFLRKPVSQDGLLAALDRQIAPPLTELLQSS
jgi:CheY-like chemotaxis protein